MDSKPKSLSELFDDLHKKFGANLVDASRFHELAAPHECRARVIRHVGVLIGRQAVADHQKLISGYFDEIFGDMVCSLYFSFIGLDIPGRMMLRRALELCLAGISYWDNPAAFWAWNSKNRDISFTELEEFLGGQGYAKFLESEGCSEPQLVLSSIKVLRKQFGLLSNVVHPKPYNFETSSSAKYTFVEDDLRTSLEMLESVQCPLLRILLCRFPMLHKELYVAFPTIDELIVGL